jgi:hypothetical protein
MQRLVRVEAHSHSEVGELSKHGLLVSDVASFECGVASGMSQ